MNWMVSSKFHIWTLWKPWRFHLSKWYTSPLDTLPGRGAQIFHSEYSKLTRIYLKTAKKNAAFVEMVSKLAEKKGITPAQFCIAWVSSLGPHMIPLPGSSWVSLKLIRIYFTPDLSSISYVLTTIPQKRKTHCRKYVCRPRRTWWRRSRSRIQVLRD